MGNGGSNQCTMGKYYEGSSTFAYTWEQIAVAFWRRYPNPYSTHVLTEDIINREIRNGCLFTKRVLTKTSRAPKWAEVFVKNNTVAIVEESYVDLKTRVLTTYTRNVGMNRIMSITEQVTYSPDPSNPTQTVANRQAWIDSQMYGLRMAIETYGLERFRSNASRAEEGFQHVLQQMFPGPQQERVNLLAPIAGLVPIPGTPSGFDGTKEKFKEKAKKAGEIARQSAGKINFVSNASCEG